MPIRSSKKIGFCFGVKRAVQMAEDVLKKEHRAYSLGSIIHNAQVVTDLWNKGLEVINNIDDAKGGCIVISSHGISPAVASEISKRSLKLVDTTCPFVSNAQSIARQLKYAGYKVIIVGDLNHPEVKALVDFAGRGAHVVKDASDIKRLGIKHSDKIGVLSQTTQSMVNFLAAVSAVIDARPKELRVFNTICKDAEERQAAAGELARTVDLILIVGGKNSANTKRLFDVCKKVLKKAYLIETENDLKCTWFKGVKAVGVTSGASTPDWVVKKVVERTKQNLRKKGRLQRLNGKRKK